MFIINFKNYDNISGSRSLELAKIASKISRKYKIKIVVCPPQQVISEITKVSIPVFAQHVDNKEMGSTTGYIVPELVKKSRVSGSLVNHSEHRLASKDIKELVSRLKALKMTSVVCVKNVSEARKYAKLNPDYIAIEPPELIGTGKAVSTEKPEVIIKSVRAVKDAKNSTRLLCGAGIISGNDVARALELGANGVLVASGIVKAKNWERVIEEFSIPFVKKRKV
ncbi:MAG: triose-phosphate isomerase [Thaumarchaeota archaeon 13_1_20CM_2_39_20]|nr:MAG: triose-phosphate isomerase [Thaumarchaeota archaeon 13_1_20CM_2_39_20]